jgi:hypothetical protein
MTPKEKANELVDKMYNVDFHDDAREIAMRYPHAIKCALVAVDEILNEYWSHDTKRRDWWQEVKQEIEKL